MSRIDRLVGLIRSLAIHHAIPLRQRRLRRRDRQFVEPGDLVFDIGAHAGNRTRAFAALGCRVVALEPQPDFARLCGGCSPARRRIEIVEAAAGLKSWRKSNRDIISAHSFLSLPRPPGQASASSKHFQEARHGRRSPAPVRPQSASA